MAIRLLRLTFRLPAFGLCSTMAMVCSAAPAPAPVSFNNQVQPILSEHCYPCHGPDSATRKPKKSPLRLDREKFAFEPRDDGKPVIVKGDPKASEVVRRIEATDDDVMPPVSQHKPLKAEQIQIIKRWISEGAKYEKHWSLIPPARPEPPVDSSGWAKQPIDRFVAARLKQAALKPNPEEAKARLYRRLSFDLTGLPPSVEELRAFLNDRSPRAYEQAVDRMLASDACAEQFSRHWLDAVRYADTQGIHHDHMRSIWPYRDWVIAAFKANKPFNEFTLEQIAGDLLPNPTLDQKIASGYNRLLPTTGEGGAIADEYAAIYAKDRVDTTAAVWLGLTTGCATCHDHKFDPITTKDFYSMTAFFRNSTVPALDNGSDANTAPLAFVPARADRQRWTQLEQAVTEKKAAIENRKREARADFEAWAAGAAKDLPMASKGPQPDLQLPLSDTNRPSRGTAKAGSIEWAGAEEQVAGPFGPAPRVADGAEVTNASPTIRRRGQATYGAFLYLEGQPSGGVISRMNKAQGHRGWDLFLSEGRPTIHIIEQWPDRALKVTAKEALKPGRWHHVMAVFDGKKKGTVALYVNGRKVDVEVNNNNLGTNTTSDAPLRLGGRSEGAGVADTLSGGKVFLQDLRFYNRALAATEIGQIAGDGLVRDFLATAPEQRTAEQTNLAYQVYLDLFDEPNRKLASEMDELRQQEDGIRKNGATTLVMEEKKDSEPFAYILTRGNYASKGEKVGAAIPEALPSMDPGSPRNRLGLARWLLKWENPLMARVTVNRLWSRLFGMGIVETTEDFGVQGARPSNQPLLDWLAVEFMDSGWDFRHMARLMVLSSTYRQSEKVTPAKLERDPLNKLFARGPHVRLDAEELRDQALAASGLLVRRVGGPPAKPYQPEGVWEAVAMKVSNTRVYEPDKGDGLYRRSLYTFWKRTAPPPSMEILNAPSRDVFCTRRDRTDTPLQAFVTLNDPQFVEAARQLAGRTITRAKDFDGRLDLATEALLGRRFEKPERAVIRRLVDSAQQKYQADAAQAAALISVGESKADGTIPPAELAAWTIAASELMNLDEALTK
ncbi:MAG TPA: DUF1553 domain-containing protein [Methylomirabilota bacterium]|nr:DUF1553 domain-containing protein [Methylomirabilota bacterium]